MSLFVLQDDRSKVQIMSEEKLKTVPGNFVICDVQTEYAECLFRILTDRLSGAYQFHLFADIDRAVEFARTAGADTFLVSEEYREQAAPAPARRRFVLTETPCGKVIGDSPVQPVFRYQSAEAIIRELDGKPEAAPEPEKAPVKRPDKKSGGRHPPVKVDAQGLIGIYSPVHRIGKTRYALRLGRKLAMQVPVLYLSLEGFSGGSYYFPGEGGSDLGDLLYCLRQERTDYGLKISSMTGQLGRLDYIRPMRNEADLRDVKRSEWMRLLDVVGEQCAYKAVILDLGDGICGLYDILGRCERIYTPYISDPVSMAKIRQYEENLREAGREEILRRTVKRLMKRKGADTAKDGG